MCIQQKNANNWEFPISKDNLSLTEPYSIRDNINQKHLISNVFLWEFYFVLKLFSFQCSSNR